MTSSRFSSSTGGFRPQAQFETDVNFSYIRIPDFAEIAIRRDTGGWEMPDVKTFKEGAEFAPAARLGWPSGRGDACKVACIFADFYAVKKRGEKPPYFRFTPEESRRKARVRFWQSGK